MTDNNFFVDGSLMNTAGHMTAVYEVSESMVLEVTLRGDNMTIDLYPTDNRMNGAIMTKAMMAHEWADFLFSGEPGSDTAMRECDKCERMEYAHLSPDWPDGICNFCMADDEEGV